MKLIIVHYHLRPGGIRRIIELATPHLMRNADRSIERVVLACGEANDRKWIEGLVRRLPKGSVEFFVEPAFRYLSEQRGPAARVEQRIRAALDGLLGDGSATDCLVWAHNPGVGRNLLLARELVRATGRRGIPLVAHHHDWWFDNRWLRWPEMRRSGFRTLDRIAGTVLAAGRNVRHVAINDGDARLLRRHFPKNSAWLPNLTEPFAAPSADKMEKARDWLRRQMNAGEAPVWIVPCRLLRRKNIAEALLLKQWLRPEGWLVTTGDVSSADEEDYARDLHAAARRQGWKLRLGVLKGSETRAPAIPELLAVSEAVLLTSLQEGFGLPYLEAAAARRPLIARAIPNVAPDLERFGFRFPQCYDEILVDPRLFDWNGEQRRQRRLFREWRSRLPARVRRLAGEPALFTTRHVPESVPFSRLTLTAQLQVLMQSRELSWKRCAALNPFLNEWRERASTGSLGTTPWPDTASRWLSGEAYARRFAKIASGPSTSRDLRDSDDAIAAQEEFLREKLSAENLFPLLWARKT